MKLQLDSRSALEVLSCEELVALRFQCVRHFFGLRSSFSAECRVVGVERRSSDERVVVSRGKCFTSSVHVEMRRQKQKLSKQTEALAFAG